MRCAEQECPPGGGGDLRRAVGCQGRTRPGVRPRLPSLNITHYLQIMGVKPSVHAGCDQNMSVVTGCCEAPYDTRESVSDGARALQVGGIEHVGGCCEAPCDTRESAESDPNVSKTTFRVESEKVCLRVFNRPFSLSKATFVSGQAKSEPKKLGFGGP
jgi:hypothetical protein